MAKTIRSEGHQALCEALIAARKAAGLTQSELANRLRCHQSFVARVESGERRIDVIELIVLARALSVHSSILLEAAENATRATHRI
ncbi:helix-turn-helix domain-containing protein [Roseinatronobacter sp. S2]|uniref:helix-turn-helix domain-containing protein n=1 Tax=Roseinatronobacter sp. S2 TaxID=3035471 RepID=UPI00240FC774|nr:helix-turn-helix transcriptional regulator [Roseinatronobacter sp. S2]WFE77301.1 helix-turn-helix transcriptional regulator [Roseinatronobacter sp. S2]